MSNSIDIDGYDVSMNRSNTRLELVADPYTEMKLLGQYDTKGFTVIDVAEIYPSDEGMLQEPVALLTSIKDMRFDEVKVVRGFTNYLSIWDNEAIGRFFSTLKTMLNNQTSNVVFVIVESLYRSTVFHNPKYVNDRQIVRLRSSHQEESVSGPTFTILDSDYGLDYPLFATYKDLVHELCRAEPGHEYIWAVKNRGKKPTGVVSSVRWPDSYAEIISSFLNLNFDLPESVAKSLLMESKRSSLSVPDYLEKSTCAGDGHDTNRILEKLIESNSNPLFRAYAKYALQRIPSDTYLSFVLSTYDGSDSLKHHYFVNAALKALSHKNRVRFSEERRDAFRFLGGGSDGMIQEFVQNSSNNPDSVQWLNCGTRFERAELICRLFTRDVSAGIPSEISRVYPELNDYLGLEYEYKNELLTDYFRRYRACKLTNRLPPDFIETVNGMEYPWNVDSRQKALSEYSGTPDVALLMVDGLGAEYLPLLVSKLRDHGVLIEREDVVRANLPTSTRFNGVNNGANGFIKLDEIKSLDNTAHDGAIKHEKATIAENICKSLDVVIGEVVQRIVCELGKDTYAKMIITADHGLTRLAVLAHENGCDETILGDYEKAEDWRYTPALASDSCPEGVMAANNHQFNTTYWVITNYNRFSKAGGKKYETHGGATLEECLVPFIVVSGVKAGYSVEYAEVYTDVPPGDAPQVVEKDLFEGF